MTNPTKFIEEWNTDNSGGPYTDEELIVILSEIPTKENCIKLAKCFKRGSGAIEQIYRWAMTSKCEIARKRGKEKFVNQIKRISKEVGWLS